MTQHAAEQRTRNLTHVAVRLLARSHRMIVVASLLIAATAATLIWRQGLCEDYSITSFVAQDSPAYGEYVAAAHRFVSNELAIIAVRTDDALSVASLELLDRLERGARAVPGVEAAVSIASLPAGGFLSGGHPLAGGLGALVAGATVADAVRARPAIADALRDALRSDPLVADNLLSRDGRTAAVVLHVESVGRDPARRRLTVARLREMVRAAQRDYPRARIVLGGPAITMFDIFDFIRRDLRLFSWLVGALIIGTLVLIFRSAGAVIMVGAVAASATLTTLALSVALHISMALLSQLVVIMVSILAVANCVHLLVRAQELSSRGVGDRTAAIRLLHHMVRPTLAASATTAAGVGALAAAELKPFHHFAGLVAFGVLYGWLLSVAWAFLLVRQGAHRRGGREGGQGALACWLPQTVGKVLARRRLVIGSFAGVAVAGGLGALRLTYESDFLKNFRADTHVRRDYAFIESHLAPAGTIDVILERRDGLTVLDPVLIREAEDFAEEMVRRHEPLRKALTLGSLLRAGGQRFPDTPLALGSRVALMRGWLGEDALRAFVSADGQAMKIHLRVVEGLQVREKLALVEAIAEAARERFGNRCDVTVTGLYPLYARLIADLVRDQARTFAVAVGAVLLLMAVLIGSWRLALVCLVPNLVPMALCVGVMGWAGIAVNLATAAILAVAIGIAVDASVHYAWRYLEERRSGRPVREALERTQAVVGRACVFMEIIVVGGFWVLCLSPFLPTAYFGGLIGLTMAGALVCNLLLLPVLVAVWTPNVGGTGLIRERG